jgi:hypothetical protein
MNKEDGFVYFNYILAQFHYHDMSKKQSLKLFCMLGFPAKTPKIFNIV